MCKGMGFVRVTIMLSSCLHCIIASSTGNLHALLQLQDPLQHVTLLCLHFPDNSFMVLPFSIQLVSLQQRLYPETLTEKQRRLRTVALKMDKN